MRQAMKLGCACLLVMCPLTVGISALSNLGLPKRSEVVDRLNSAEKARLAESLHLQLGDSVCRDWGQAEEGESCISQSPLLVACVFRYDELAEPS